MAILAVKAGTILWPAALIGMALLLAVAVLAARHFYIKSLGNSPHAEVFTIEKLTELRDNGQLSKDEFDTLRRAALGLSVVGGEKDDWQSSARAKLDDEAVNDTDG